MSSAAVYAACATFLETDVRTGVNAEQTGALVAGSVKTTRRPRGSTPRVANAFPLSVEIVPQARAPGRAIGPTHEECDYTFDLEINLRRKALPTGATQLATVEDVARALIRRYQAATGLSITATGATFRRAACFLQAFEDGSDAELERALVRLTLTFTEALAAN